MRTADGSWTLRHPEHGEGCHSRSGAWQEACERYARPCKLRERARELDSRPLRLLDVGTGLGLNLAAALWALEGTDVALEATSLERDPSVVRAALALHVAGEVPVGPGERWHAPVRAALARSLEGDTAWVPLGERGRLRLLLGDGRETLSRLQADASAAFDAVFLDPFSRANEPDLWKSEFLVPVARRMAPGSWLSTYSASFAVRLTLARAGLVVGRGPRVGAKAEGTLASPDGSPPGLSERLRRKLERALRTS